MSSDAAAAYRIRAQLDGTDPPLWRQVEVSADLRLDELHDVLQVVFGWTDSHLHRFAAPDGSQYLCPFDVAEGDAGVPDEQVRVRDVLTEVGARLTYLYDYGDGWEHHLKLEAVVPREPGDPPARCTGGDRPGPPEDCGGPHTYELIAAAQDPDHPRRADAAGELKAIYGDEIDPADFALTPLHVDTVDLQLDGLGMGGRPPMPAGAPGPLAELLDGLFDPAVRRPLARLLTDAELDAPTPVDPEKAAAMVGPYRWLLERVGAAGIALTQAGYLPPRVVADAVGELGLEQEWPGAGNREHQTLPVLHLRESAQAFGLVRKQRGRLLPTARGRALAGDPVGLWTHLAERMPLGSRDEAERQAGLVLLLVVAAGADDPPDELAAQVLHARGWRHGDGTPLSHISAIGLLWDNRMALRRLGALTGDDVPTPAGRVFARAALRS